MTEYERGLLEGRADATNGNGHKVHLTKGGMVGGHWQQIPQVYPDGSYEAGYVKGVRDRYGELQDFARKQQALCRRTAHAVQGRLRKGRPGAR